jgi:hypothetical protein
LVAWHGQEAEGICELRGERHVGAQEPVRLTMPNGGWVKKCPRDFVNGLDMALKTRRAGTLLPAPSHCAMEGL